MIDEKDAKNDAKKDAKKDVKKDAKKDTKKDAKKDVKKDAKKRCEKKTQKKPITAEIICVAPINKAFIAAFVLRTVRNHYIIKNIELIILSNQWTPLVDNFCWLVSY